MSDVALTVAGQILVLSVALLEWIGLSYIRRVRWLAWPMALLTSGFLGAAVLKALIGEYP